jgi:uncharacterized protein
MKNINGEANLSKPAQPELRRFTRILKQHMPELARRYKVKSLGMFGSYVRNEQSKRSDLDVLVEFENDAMTLLEFIEVQNYLSDLLGVKVDLVEKSGLRPSIRQCVLLEVEPI